MTDNPLEAEGDIAADYLEGFLDIIDVDGDLEMDVENGRAMVAIVGEDLDDLVGDDGEVLDALQDLARLAVMRETGHRSRLMLDVGGYRAALRTSPDQAAWWMGLGLALERSHRLGEARIAFETALATPGLDAAPERFVRDRVRALASRSRR